MFKIASPNDGRVEAYRNVKERDLVGRQGLFVAEGEVVLRMLLRSSLMQVESVLITESRLESLSAEISLLSPDVPILIASQSVMDSIVGFHIHRGILAIGKRKSSPTAHDLISSLPSESVILALVGVSNHDNMGGIFRNAAAFGADAIIADSTSCDPLYRKSIRVSVGGVFQVPFARIDTSAELLPLLAEHGFSSFALSPRAPTELANIEVPDRSAIILGSEGEGLPSELINQSQGIRIQMAQGFDSLNVATTSGIVLHHFAQRGSGTSRFANP